MAQDEREDGGGNLRRGHQAAGGEAGAVAQRLDRVEQDGAAHGVDGAAPAGLQQRPLRALQGVLARQDLPRAEAAQEVVARCLAGDRVHLVAEMREQLDGDRADPAGGAGDEHGAAVRPHAGRLELVHAQRGGEAGGAQDHAGARVEPIRQRDGPTGRNPDLLAEAARRVHAEVEADGDDRVSRREVAGRRFDDGPRRVDARCVREVAGDAGMPGRREPVLVVERRPRHVDQQVAGGQVRHVALDDVAGELPVCGLLDPKCAKRGHLFSFCECPRGRVAA